MRKWILLGIVLVLSACTSQKNVNALFNQYKQTENSSLYNVPVQIVKFLPLDNIPVADILTDIKDIKILTINDLNEEEKSKFNRELKNALEADGFNQEYYNSTHGRMESINTQSSIGKFKYVVIALERNDKITFIKADASISKLKLKKLIDAIKND